MNEVVVDKKFYVYMHTNKINGKKYVGITSQDPEKRWEKGKGYRRHPHFWNAINKYGWDNFEHDILLSDISLDDANTLERMLIRVWKLQNPRYGYNMQSGGKDYATLSEDIKKKISDSNKGRTFSEEHRRNISESKKNRPLTEKELEHLEKIKYWNKGRKFTEEHRQNLSKSLKGRIFTEEHKENIRKSRKGQHTEKQKEALKIVCENNKGRKHTEEAKEKIRIGNKGKVKTNSIKVGQYTIDTGELVNTYDSITIAHNETGITYSGIHNCVFGISNSSGGFVWKKIDD